jgi:hypothetical protein
MANQAKGRLIKIYPTKLSNSGFASREFVIETEEKYPQFVKFQVIKDACDLLDNIKVNDILEVSFNLRGAAYAETRQEVKDGQIVKIPTGETAYFSSVQAWKIEVVGRDDSYEPVQTKTQANTAEQNIRNVYNTKPDDALPQIDDKDDLPF